MKRLTVAFAALGLTAAVNVSAALPAATDPTLVNVPELSGGFVLGVTGLYLEASPTNGDLDFASINAGLLNTFSSRLQTVEPGFDWGLGLNAGYIFPNTGNDINASYFYLDTDKQKNVFTFVPNFITSNNFFQSITNDFIYAQAENDYRINQVDLTAGQFINVGCRLRLHPNVGVRYAEVQRELDTFYLDNSDANSLSNVEESDFTGIGPLAGLDASYFLGMGLGVVAHVDSALLIGDIDTQTHSVISINQAGTLNQLFYKLQKDSGNRVVPVTDMKLGVDYTYMVNDAQNSDFTFELGYQASHYYDAIDRLAVALGSASGNILMRKTSGIGLSGPYVSITFHA